MVIARAHQPGALTEEKDPISRLRLSSLTF
jgi:hypothetical protein